MLRLSFFVLLLLVTSSPGVLGENSVSKAVQAARVEVTAVEWRGGISQDSVINLARQSNDPVKSFERATLTLEDLVGAALRQSELLVSYQARIEERSYASEQAKVLPNPSLEFSLGRREVSSQSGPLFGVAAVQPLKVFGRQELRGAIIGLDPEVLRIQRTAAASAITLNVIRLAYEYAAVGQRLDLIEARRKRLDLMRAYLSGRIIVSPQKKAESRLVEQRLRRIAADALQTQMSQRTILERLSVYVSVHSRAAPAISVPWFSAPLALVEEEWIDRGLAGNPVARAQTISVKAAGLERLLASREAMPEFAVVGFYGQATAAETERNLGVGLRMTLPIWNRNEAGIRSAEQKEIAEERLLGSQLQRMRAEVRRSLAEYDVARTLVAQYPLASLSVLEAYVRETEDEFRKGRVDLLTFLELDSEIAQTSASVLEAQVNLVTTIVELLAVTGEQEPLLQFRGIEGRSAQ